MEAAASEAQAFVALSALEHHYKNEPERLRVLREMVALAKLSGKGKVFETAPVVNNKPLDLVRLYEEVAALGGIGYVTSNKRWGDIPTEVVDLPSYTLEQVYAKYLESYEQLKLFGKPPKGYTLPTKPSSFTTLQQARRIRMTNVPTGSKQIRMYMQKMSDLTALQKLVLALDCGLKDQVDFALNQLTVMSFTGGNDDSVLYVSKVPGILDALFRQLQDHITLEAEPVAKRYKISALFNLSNHVGERHVFEGRLLIVLNIMRNLSFSLQNQRPIGTHKHLPSLLVKCLKARNVEIKQHALDILSSVSRYIGMSEDETDDDGSLDIMRRRNFPGNDVGDPEQVTKELAQEAMSLLFSNNREEVLSSCEILMNVARRPVNETIFENAPDAFFRRLSNLLSMNATGVCSLKSQGCAPKSNGPSWLVPWSDSNQSIGSGMGVVYGPKETAHSSWPSDEYLDHEVRDAAVEAIYHIANYGPIVKLKIAKQPFCLRRISGTLISRSGRAEAARIAAGALSNISMNPKTFPYFLSIEKDLVLVVSADENVSDLLSNVIADVYGMQSIS